MTSAALSRYSCHSKFLTWGLTCTNAKRGGVSGRVAVAVEYRRGDQALRLATIMGGGGEYYLCLRGILVVAHIFK
jgi:hypothetical protein